MSCQVSKHAGIAQYDENIERTPAFTLRLRNTRRQRCWRDVPVGRITGIAGFTDNKLVLRDAGGDNLEQGAVWPLGRRGGQEARASRVVVFWHGRRVSASAF